jgi:uncharacterized protein DUF4390
VRACVLALLLLALAGPAHAFKLTAIRPARDTGNQLWVELRIEKPIEPRVAASLARGMPATLSLHAELWRRRNGWFDRMERAADATFRMHYEVWSDTWRLSRPGAPLLLLSSLDSLELVLARTLALNVSPLARFSPDVSCYVVVSATLRPLNIEDVEEVELWLSGEVREKKRRPFGFLTGVPLSLFDAARNFAGFGDEHSRLISVDFTPATLPPFGR